MTASFARKFSLTVLAIALLLQTPAVYGSQARIGREQEQPLYEKVIAHGGGSYKGYETTNSVEAVNQSIANGFKIIELDMELSSDHKIIMLHDWDRTAQHYYGTSFPKKLSQSQFSHLMVFGKLEVLSFDKLAGIMNQNRDIRIVTDTKSDNIELLTVISQKYPDLVSRIIPQIYDYDQWSEVKKLGFADVIFTLYAMADPDMDKLASFVRDHPVYAVTMPDYFAERGYCKELSDKGIPVYIHPVSNYEAAQRYMKQGACGVYTGSLLPEEFSGVEKDYYLTEQGAGGPAIKLTDDLIESLKELKLHGVTLRDTVLYYLDQSSQCADEDAFSELSPGKHKLTVKILDGKTVKGMLVYSLWKNKNNYRVLHKKFEYRLDEARQGKDFCTAIEDESIPGEVRVILERSLIAKEGESAFYNNGSQEGYTNGDELLPVQKESFGRLLLPLSATLQRLGASSVMMNRGKDITIIFNGETSRIMAGSSIVRKGFRVIRQRTPVVLYLNKAMAGGEFFSCITGRSSIEKDGFIIILPEGVSPGVNMEKKLLEAAGGLF